MSGASGKITADVAVIGGGPAGLVSRVGARGRRR